MGYTLTQAQAFIDRIAPIMQAEAFSRGYKVVSTAIAQAIIEGAAGTSTLAAKYHNHFGMKCGKSWKGSAVVMKTKEEYTPGTLTDIKDAFRAYADDYEGIRGYYDFISAKRYDNLKGAADPEEYARLLKADGYATSSTYVNTLITTVKKYNLARFDAGQKEIEYYPAYNGDPDANLDYMLLCIGVNDKYIGSYKARRPIAEKNGFYNYIGSAEDNQKLKALILSGKLKK